MRRFPGFSHLSRRTILGLMLACVALAGLGGCGYHHKPIYPADVRTVTVKIFDNRSFYRGVEFDLAEALGKEIELRTPYKVAASEHSDTIVQGTITGISQSTLSRTDPGGLPAEQEVRITVDFEWKNLRTGQILRQRKGYTSVGRYVPTSPVGQMFELGQHAAVQRLSREIVSIMGADW